RTEPDQYYYPSPDLHLTVFEICHSLYWEEAAAIAETMASEPGVWLKGTWPFELRAPVMTFDERGCGLSFDADHLLVSLRAFIGNRVSHLGIPLKPRYSNGSAHITFMRYARPLTTNAEKWWKLLRCLDRKSTRLNSSHVKISYAVFCLKKKK